MKRTLLDHCLPFATPAYNSKDMNTLSIIQEFNSKRGFLTPPDAPLPFRKKKKKKVSSLFVF